MRAFLSIFYGVLIWSTFTPAAFSSSFFPTISSASEIQATATRGATFPLTVLSTAQLQTLDTSVRNAFTLETYFDDWCDARATLISHFASSQGIHNGVIYIEGSPDYVVNPRTGETIGWDYHVATVFLGPENKLYIIDPFFLEPLMPLENWLQPLASLSTYQFSNGTLTLDPTYATIDFVSPFFHSPPYEMDDASVWSITAFDQDFLNEAAADYPIASTYLDLRGRLHVPTSPHRNHRHRHPTPLAPTLTKSIATAIDDSFGIVINQ